MAGLHFRPALVHKDLTVLALVHLVGIAVVGGVIAGSFVMAKASGQFRVESFTDATDMVRHMVGGAIMGIGGLGHMAVQYAVAMGLNVVAVDVDDAKLELARKLGAVETVNARTDNDPAATVKRLTGGGARGALVTAVSEKAFEQAVGMVGRGGTLALNGLPPGDFPLNIFGMVLNGITVRGSIVGTRLDLQESLDFAADGKVKATISTAGLDDINAVFDRMRQGQIEGRVVLDMTQ